MAKEETAQKKKWFDGLKAEFRKIIWPTRDDLQKETTAVVVCSVIVGVLIALIDFVVQHGVDWLINLKF